MLELVLTLEGAKESLDLILFDGISQPLVGIIKVAFIVEKVEVRKVGAKSPDNLACSQIDLLEAVPGS